MSYKVLAKALLRDHEGLRLKTYLCTAGRKTIGYGHNIEDNGLPKVVAAALIECGEITKEIAEEVLEVDVRNCIVELDAQYDYWFTLPGDIKAAIIDMYFCLGANRFAQFKKMHRALEERDYRKAAYELLDSRFATQTGRRAVELADIVRSGGL